MTRKTRTKPKSAEVTFDLMIHEELAARACHKIEEAAKAATKMGTAHFKHLEKYHFRHEPTRVSH